MQRRDFITLLGGAVAAWPLAARAQQAAMPVVGSLGTTTANDFTDRVAAFREGLKEAGYVEGQNVVIEYRWPEGNYDRLAALAADLVRRQVAVIAAVGGEPSSLAAKAATATIPIVFSIGRDPVKLGLVASLNRPGGNITGVNFLQSELGVKRLGLLHELLPKATVIGMLINPNFADAEIDLKEVQEAALPLGLQIHVLRASTEGDIDTAFATLVQQKVDGLVLANDAFFLRSGATTANRTGSATCNTHGLLLSRVSRRRRLDELRSQPHSSVSPGGYIHRKNPQGCQTRRPASGAAKQVRVCDQS